jgi:hypothetical protein
MILHPSQVSGDRRVASADIGRVHDRADVLDPEMAQPADRLRDRPLRSAFTLTNVIREKSPMLRFASIPDILAPPAAGESRPSLLPQQTAMALVPP